MVLYTVPLEGYAVLYTVPLEGYTVFKKKTVIQIVVKN